MEEKKNFIISVTKYSKDRLSHLLIGNMSGKGIYRKQTF